MPDNLKLNTLDRFTKQPGLLALQESSHCEVPAGCGGVVLRWIDPRAGRFVHVDGYAWGRRSFCFDQFAGGCRVRSRALNGSVWAPDPRQTEWSGAAGQGPDPEAIVEVPHG